MKKQKTITWICLLCITFMFAGCHDINTVCEFLNDNSENVLFIEYDIVQGWGVKDGKGFYINMLTMGDYDFSDNKTLKIRVPFSEIDSETKLLIGERFQFTPECGSGIGGNVRALKNYYSQDSIGSNYLKHSINILGCDYQGIVRFKLNNYLFELKPDETYADTITVRDINIGGVDCDFLTSVLTIKNSGFIEKNNVIY